MLNLIGIVSSYLSCNYWQVTELSYKKWKLRSCFDILQLLNRTHSALLRDKKKSRSNPGFHDDLCIVNLFLNTDTLCSNYSFPTLKDFMLKW